MFVSKLQTNEEENDEKESGKICQRARSQQYGIKLIFEEGYRV